MLALILDEPVTPSMCPELHRANVDAYHVRDRNLCGMRDDQIWARAHSERRAVVTTNGVDFRALAENDETHPGVVVIPAYGNKIQQLAYVMGVVHWANEANALLPSLRNYFITVQTNLGINAEILIHQDNEKVVKTIA